LKTRRRELRKALTTAEATLWLHLQRSQLSGFKFRRQHSVGPYVLDFYCPAAKLAVELDGAAHDSEVASLRDDRRDRYLAAQGIRTVRFVNGDVTGNLEGVLASIRRVLEAT